MNGRILFVACLCGDSVRWPERCGNSHEHNLTELERLCCQLTKANQIAQQWPHFLGTKLTALHVAYRKGLTEQMRAHASSDRITLILLMKGMYFGISRKIRSKHKCILQLKVTSADVSCDQEGMHEEYML